MALQTATNPQTGERVALVGNEWKPITQTATNQAGVKAYLVGNEWIVDEAPAQKPAPTQPALASGAGTGAKTTPVTEKQPGPPQRAPYKNRV
jgi:hypothetical protein